MKLHWFVLSLTSIVLLSSPAKATPSQSAYSNQSRAIAQSKYSNSIADNNSSKELDRLPEIEFIAPKPETDSVNSGDRDSFAEIVPTGKEMSPLNSQIQALMARYSFLLPGMFFLDLQSGDYLNINGDKAFPAASTIKFPILIALFQEIEAGRVRFDESLVMRRDLVAGGSGDMQSQSVGSRFSVLQTATKMMTISDNTATNMIIDRLGGKAVLNQRFQSWGLKNTTIRNLLADVNGTNTTSAKDLVRLSALVTNDKLINNTSRSQVLQIMRQCHNQSMLPSGLGSGAIIAHKTGTLRFVLGDAGIIQTPNGKIYLAGILVKRPNHDSRATEFIRQVSRFLYDYENTAQLTGFQR
ncbi:MULTISPECIES: serine hydrolase [Nostocales]|uniref:Beta-lactamase n=3 Tax=Nostocales TaxID=1161 RepID=A0A0C1NBP0_9CYAN|nr:serine hydrolase [Tolypothrix bouteillei]KAF3890462.1 serine hydrolase [Tolypothrix bouteillei VB521301]